MRFNSPKFYLMLIFIVSTMLAGCSGIHKQVPDASWTEYASPQLSRNDYVVLERVEGEATTTSFLFGIVQIIDDKLQIFWIKFFEDEYAVESGYLTSFRDRTIDRAYFKTLAKSPDADAMLKRTITIEESGIPFIYNTETVRCAGKAIKIKTDAELSK